MKLTWTSLAYRSIWELDRRSGFKALRTPRGSVPIPNAVPSYDAWWGALGAGHRLRRLRTNPPAIFWEPGGPPGELDWHLEPHRGEHWPAREHWTRAMDALPGDLRLTWERNRFSHVWEWLAAGEDHADEFAAQVVHWRRHNAFRSGVNWASGQELAVRSLAWLTGVAVYGPRFDAATWRDFVELLYWHGVHIDSEFGLARHAVRNNHLIAEGLALAAIGDAFGCLDEANGWKWRGLEAVEQAVGEQFLGDGGYCQSSHAYHHFALQLLLEAWAWFDDLHGVLRPVFERSIRYFEAVLEQGEAPNFGPNDRVLSPDFSALLDALRLAIDCPLGPTPSVASLPDSGLVVLRDDGLMATLRCGELPDRAGHDDGLHIDVWVDGTPLAIDAGSFLYSGPTANWFASARSHNVCLVGSEEPRERLSTFTWDRVEHPWLVELDARRKRALCRYDTAFREVTWERELIVGGRVEVVDKLNVLDERPRVFHLHWLLDADITDVDVVDHECFTWNITTPTSSIEITATPLVGELGSAALTVNAAEASATYGSRRLVTSALLSVTGRGVQFRTRFGRR